MAETMKIESVRVRAATNGVSVNVEYTPRKSKSNAPSIYEPSKDSVFTSAREAKAFVGKKLDALFEQAMTDNAWKIANSKWGKSDGR